MKIRFLGATRTVTGSCSLVTHGKTQVLVDCGLFQGFKPLRLRNWNKLPVAASDVEAVLLTHAHLDHSGYLPLLVRSGYRGPIYSTPPTVSLCQILLPDSGYLQEEEAKFANRLGYSKHRPALALYTIEDAHNALKLFEPAPWGAPVKISRNGLGTLEAHFYRAGHLLGAASIQLRTESSSIAFSGDLGRKSSPLIREADPGFVADTLVVEATYGNRRHPARDPERELEGIIHRTQARKGIVLIPSFAVGRAQSVIYYLYRLKLQKKIPDIPIYLDSPMAAQANQAFAAHLGELKVPPQEMLEACRAIRVVSSPAESRALTGRAEPSVIIAASGMATGGRVLHHLKSIAPDPKNTLLFVGFQAGGTRGEAMVHGATEVKIHGRYWPIRAEVVTLQTLSAHADGDEIIEWIQHLKRKPKRVFVTHGESDAVEALRQRIATEVGVEAIIPEYDQEFDVT